MWHSQVQPQRLRWSLCSLIAFAAASWQGASGRSLERPNLIWFLTDDQDQVLGGALPPTAFGTPMPKTKRLLQDEGIHATNWYIHTPICCPSRSELLTGRYFHNIKREGGNCVNMHVNITYPTQQSFVRILKEEAGYSTGLFGKYLNEMPKTAPPGYDAWFANDGGDYIAPTFQTQGLESLGLPDGSVKFTAAASNYSTSVIGNYSIKWMRKVAKEKGKPFFAYIAPKAVHEPFNPAPWYRDAWDSSWPSHEPRGPAWNSTAQQRAKHHGNIATQPMLSPAASKVITGIFKNRWRCLMSVDDLISDIVKFVEEELGAGHSTYFLYSSDHGFQLGQFNIPMDKRHVYEWDTKIHLLARGPGISAGSSFNQPGTQVDIAPTLLGLAGIKAPPIMDGKSIVPFLLNTEEGFLDGEHWPFEAGYEESPQGPIILFQEGSDSSRNPVMPATRTHLTELGDLMSYRLAWRQEVFVEHYFCSQNSKCVEGCKHTRGPYPHADSLCVDLAANRDCWCPDYAMPPRQGCYLTEDTRNNFIALRRLSGGENLIYAEFEAGNLAKGSVNFDKINFIELYNLSTDQWQMNNLAGQPSLRHKQDDLRVRLRKWFTCAGSTCP